MTTAHPRGAPILRITMFDNVIIGADDAEAGRDALALAQQLAAPRGQVTLAYVQVGAPPPEPDSAAMSLAADRQPASTSLRSLRDESHLDARVVVVQDGLCGRRAPRTRLQA